MRSKRAWVNQKNNVRCPNAADLETFFTSVQEKSSFIKEELGKGKKLPELLAPFWVRKKNSVDLHSSETVEFQSFHTNSLPFLQNTTVFPQTQFTPTNLMEYLRRRLFNRVRHIELRAKQSGIGMTTCSHTNSSE